MKILDPFSEGVDVSPLRDVRVLWMNRDLGQQVKSLNKFTREILGLQYRNRDLKRLRTQLIKDRTVALARWPEHGRITVHQFDDAVIDPHKFAAELAGVMPEYSLDVDAMAAAVHDRGPRCLPDLAFELEAVVR